MTPTTPAEFTDTLRVNAGWPVGVFTRVGALHVLPPSVVFENHVGPVNDEPLWRNTSGLLAGETRRSHTA